MSREWPGGADLAKSRCGGPSRLAAEPRHGHAGDVRVAVIAESFLPHMNGVTGSILQVTRHLGESGHRSLVVAPGGPGAASTADTLLLRSAPLPQYPQVRIAFASVARLTEVLRRFQPDVLHLASPFVLGWQALAAADALRLPAVAVYQTDVVAYAARYGLPSATAVAERHLARLHRRATLSLVPSSASERQLDELGIDRLRRWGRGVDAALFAPERRSDALRAALAPRETIVGYVGRLAPEKQVEDLRILSDLPGVRLVIVGDGPSRPGLERLLPDARFLGHLSGPSLAAAVASFDVAVHPGESETFGQTIQEALASGVPVVATGVGGPVDLIRPSVDGWLYRPGDLAELRDRVADLVGDPAKRRAFAVAARESARDRTWAAQTRALLAHYEEAIELRRIDDALPARTVGRPASALRSVPPQAPPRWARYVALGDSITEGLWDSSRMPPGEVRGWADRLASLLAPQVPGGFRYANLAVRSRRVEDLEGAQLAEALRLRPDLVSILMGANDLVRRGASPDHLAARVGAVVRTLRAAGCDVLLVTPFLPRRRAAAILARRFARFNACLRVIARDAGAILLDLEAVPAVGDVGMWSDDRVHLRPRGHRLVAYRAAQVLGVANAEALEDLDAAFHDDEVPAPGSWLVRDVLPWIWRRARGRTAGDGRRAKHDGYVEVITTFAPPRPRRQKAT